jgi:hypothetical protein
MKRINIILITLFISVLHVFGSSGDGISFRINNFKLKINWTWQDNIPSLYGAEGVDIILMIRDNYEILSKRNEDLWIDYWFNEKTNNVTVTFHRDKDDEWDLFAEETIPLDDSCYEKFENLIRKELKLKERVINECELYIAFIPSSYIDADSIYQKEVMWFLRQSELYLAHEMALQNNIQGYVYSIFFNKNVMYNYLKKIKVKKLIINKKSLNYDSVYSLDITLF